MKAANNGISVAVVHARLSAGWTKEEALTTPTQPKGKQAPNHQIKRITQAPPKPSPEQKDLIQGKIPEITIKFSQKPICSTEGKKVTLKICAENNIIIKATLNGKSLRKAVAKMDEYEEWVASISGQIAHLSGNILTLESAGIQVFEKKKKPTSESID